MVKRPNNQFLECLAPNCENAFFLKKWYKEEVPQRNIKCTCGYSRCSACTNQGHKPIKCILHEVWNKFVSSKTDYLNEACKK